MQENCIILLYSQLYAGDKIRYHLEVKEPGELFFFPGI